MSEMYRRGDSYYTLDQIETLSGKNIYKKQPFDENNFNINLGYHFDQEIASNILNYIVKFLVGNLQRNQDCIDNMATIIGKTMEVYDPFLKSYMDNNANYRALYYALQARTDMLTYAFKGFTYNLFEVSCGLIVACTSIITILCGTNSIEDMYGLVFELMNNQYIKN